MVVVVVLFLGCVIRTVFGTCTTIPDSFLIPSTIPAPSTRPASLPALLWLCSLTSIRCHLYISEEVKNPRRNIMLATVLVCLITGVLSGLEVYAAQTYLGISAFLQR